MQQRLSQVESREEHLRKLKFMCITSLLPLAVTNNTSFVSLDCVVEENTEEH